MSLNTTKTLLVSGSFLLIFLGAWALAAQGAELSRGVAAVLGFLPYILAGLGLPVAIWFRRSRMFFWLAFIVLAQWTLATYAPAGVGDGVGGQVVYAALAVLLPLNLAGFALVPEPGLLTNRGLGQAWVVVAQVAAVAFVVSGFGIYDPAAVAGIQERVAGWLHARLFPAELDLWTWLPQPALIAWVGVGVALAARWARSRAAEDVALLAATLAMAVALHSVDRGGAPAIMFAAAALVMVGALVDHAFRLAFMDELTGLPGRRALMSDMAGLGQVYTAAMVDVDHFKKFNDTHGHDVGDQVLRMVAGRMARVTGGGRAYRYGGEEFTVLFPGRDGAWAREHLEALRKAIAAAEFRKRAKHRPPANPNPRPRQKRGGRRKPKALRVTVSIGYAEHTPKAPPEDTLKVADTALYKAKGAGRNRVKG